MSGRSVMVHHKALESYGFGDEHPFNPFRIRLTLDLCEALGLFEGAEFAGAGRASEEDLDGTAFEEGRRALAVPGGG